MTSKDLRDALSKFPEGMEVKFFTYEANGLVPIDVCFTEADMFTHEAYIVLDKAKPNATQGY